MKSLAVMTLLSLFSAIAFAQELNPVNWNFEVEKMKDGSYQFIATANIDDKWAIYSQHTGEGGPVPLEFTFDSDVELNGATEERSLAIKQMSELFEVEVIKFIKQAVFVQKFTPNESATKFKGSLRFMCCDELRCLPPTDVAFDVAL